MEEVDLNWLVWAKDKDTITDLALKAQLQEVLEEIEKLLGLFLASCLSYAEYVAETGYNNYF
jgi:hypothetical protein